MEGNFTLFAYDIPAVIPTTSKAMYFVSLINFLLFGILSLQLFLYNSFSFDAKCSDKIFVYSVYFLELLQIYTEGAIILLWLRPESGDASLLATAYESSFYAAFITSLVGFLVRSYVCCQIWNLKNGRWYNLACGVIIAGSIQQLIGSICIGVREQIEEFLFTGGTIARKSDLCFSSIWLFIETIIDLLTAAMLASMLIWSNAERCCPISSGIMKLFIHTYTFAAAVAAATLVSLFITNDNLFFVLCTLAFGKLYANILLAALNNDFRENTTVEYSMIWENSQHNGNFYW